MYINRNLKISRKIKLALLVIVLSSTFPIIWSLINNFLQETLYCMGMLNCKVWGSFWSGYIYINLFVSLIAGWIIAGYINRAKSRRSPKILKYLLVCLILIYFYISIQMLKTYTKITTDYLEMSDPWTNLVKKQILWTDVKDIATGWDYVHSAGGPGGGSWDCQLNVKLRDKNNNLYDLRNFGIDGWDPYFGSLFKYLSKNKDIPISTYTNPQCIDRKIPEK